MAFWIILSVLVFAAGLITVFRKHPDLKFASMILTLTIAAAAAVLLYPYQRLTLDPLLAVLASINSGLKIIAMDVISGVVEALQLTGTTAAVYQGLLYLYYVLAPICGSVFLLTISKSLLDKFVLRRSDAVHVFSSLNKNSIELMEYIASCRPDDQIMVLDQNTNDEELIKRASVIKTIFWKQDLEKLKLLKNTDYTFYQMDADDNDNLNNFMKLYRYVADKPQEVIDRTDIKCFIQADSSGLVRRIDQYMNRQKDKHLRISFLNVQTNEAYYLFHQLKDMIPVPKGHYELAVIGAGTMGMAIVKTALWLFDRQDCELVIHVVDRHAKETAGHLKLACPEVLNADLESYFKDFDDPARNYDIRFYQADADSADLAVIFGEMDVHPDLAVAVCGDDVANQRISENLRRILCRRNDSISCCPVAVRIRRSETFNVLNETNDPNAGVYYFGSQKEMYARIFAVNTVLEQMAVKVHLAYLNDENAKGQEVLYDTGYYTLANHESSLAQALSLEYRAKYILEQDTSGSTDKKAVLQAYVDDEENMKKLCRMEHDRWNAYERISGWTKPSRKQTEAIARMHNDGKNVRHDGLLLHPAIVDNDELAKTEQETDAILQSITPDYKPTDYVNKDAYILQKLPDITSDTL